MQTETSIHNKSSSARALGCRGLVLVVDDEEANRTLLRDPLETHGYEIVEAENGEQALEKIELRLPDVFGRFRPARWRIAAAATDPTGSRSSCPPHCFPGGR